MQPLRGEEPLQSVQPLRGEEPLQPLQIELARPRLVLLAAGCAVVGGIPRFSAALVAISRTFSGTPRTVHRAAALSADVAAPRALRGRPPRLRAGAVAGFVCPSVELGKHGKILARQNRAAADRFAHQIKPAIADLRASGITSIRAMAVELNQRQVPTAAGGRWHVQTVHRLIQRIDAQPDLRAAS